MPTVVEEKSNESRDCYGCRLVGSVGLIGIGAYLANLAWKNKTLAGKVVVSTLSLTFVALGTARYRKKTPFDAKAVSFK